jgi:2-polyprenyl-3-methyl-5-hydroxy-6-metoxy-1,4-benzoquinol methylase
MLKSWRSKDEDIQSGWDPVSAEYAEKYSAQEYANIEHDLVQTVENFVGGLSGRSVLDLGAGPGQYAVEFARRGATVVWQDVSHNYQSIAERHARDVGVKLDYQLGHLEDAAGKFDLVFNRICWYYCADDADFSRSVRKLMNPGGAAILIIADERFFRNELARQVRLRARLRMRVEFLINEWFGIKLGHPHPSRKRIARIFGGNQF